MKVTRLTAATALLVLTLSATSLTTADATSPKKAGRTASSVINTILNGKGAPSNAIGIDGDFYIDTRSLLIFGPKSHGKWPAPQNLQGPTGPTGSDGKNGSDGRTISNASTLAGPAGPQGPQGERGLPGEAGPAGPSGPAGPTGATGPAGPSGSGGTGPTGPAGATGPAGPTGTKGETGTAGSNGATGPIGPKGETGTAGATGPSEVSVVSIADFTLATSSSYGFTSTTTGSLLANSKYKFEIFLRGTSSFASLVLGAEVLASGSTVNYSFHRSDYGYATGSARIPKVYGFLIEGTVSVGASNSVLEIKIIDGYGDTSSNPLTLSGKAYITLVGAIN